MLTAKTLKGPEKPIFSISFSAMGSYMNTKCSANLNNGFGNFTVSYFCTKVFVLDFLTGLKWVGLSWTKVMLCTPAHQSVSQHLNQNVMTVMRFFAYVARPPPVKSNHTHTVLIKTLDKEC